MNRNLTLKTVIILIFMILSGCQVIQVEVEPIFYQWIVTEIKNNTESNIDIMLDGILARFDVTNDTRTLNRMYYGGWGISIARLNDNNEAEFSQTFSKMAEDGEIYWPYQEYDIYAPDWYAECVYGKDVTRKNPLGHYSYDNTAKFRLPPNSSKTVYYQFFTYDSMGGNNDRIKSVRMKLSFPNKTISLLGWDETLLSADESDDVETLYCLDIWLDDDNPDRESCHIQSQSLQCYYCKELIEINGDATSDIAVEQSYFK